MIRGTKQVKKISGTKMCNYPKHLKLIFIRPIRPIFVARVAVLGWWCIILGVGVGWIVEVVPGELSTRNVSDVVEATQLPVVGEYK